MTSDSLLSPGILSRICSFCWTRELMQLAVTSKAFFAPAVQGIWHELPSFVPLVYALPPDTWTYSKARVDGVYYLVTERTFMLKRPLVPADLARLRVYAPLVKIIREPPEISVKDVLSPSVWSSFRDHGISSLFDITSVHYIRQSPYEETQQWADPIHHFIGPSLVKLSLTLQGGHDYDDLIEDPEGLLEAQPDPVLLDMIAHLSSTCFRLHTFELDTTPFPFYAANALSDAVCRWSHLQSFEAYTCPLTPEAWRHLAALPSLSLLDAFVDLPTEVLKEVLVPGPQLEHPHLFSALRKLTLHARRLEACTVLLTAVGSTTLAKASLYAYAHASPADVEGACSALATSASRDALRELLIKPGCTTHSDPGPEPADSPTRTTHEPLPQAALAPLLALGALQKLFLLGPCFASLHNATLAAMARAFPDLWTAALCPDAPAAHRGVTLAGLGVLAPLRELRSVRLPLADVDERAVADAFESARQRERPSSSPPGPSRTPPGGSSPSAAATVSRCGSLVRTINVGRARIAEGCVEGAAAALSAWFPYLMFVNFTAIDPAGDERALRAMGFRDGEDVVAVKRRWRRVGSSVRPFVLVRRQERLWAAGK